MRRLALLALLSIAAATATAGGPGPDERLLFLGRCGTAACTYDCEGDHAACTTAGATCALPTARFAARLRLDVNDQLCEGAAGGFLTIALAGRRDDGSTFEVPDTTLDFCGVQLQDVECGGTTGLCESNIPRSLVFLCATFLGNGVLDETAVPDADWLKYSNFPPAVAQAIKEAFPSTSGEPIIVSAIEDSFDNQVGSVTEPTSRELCITGAFVEPTTTLGVPAAFSSISIATAPSSTEFGDCPPLPVVTTSTVTTSTLTTSTGPTTTTLPSSCGGLGPRDSVVCLVDGAAGTCQSIPTSLAKRRDRAASLAERAALRERPRARAKLFAKAIATLEKASRRADRSKRLDDACAAGLVAGYDAALAWVRTLAGQS